MILTYARLSSPDLYTDAKSTAPKEDLPQDPRPPTNDLDNQTEPPKPNTSRPLSQLVPSEIDSGQIRHEANAVEIIETISISDKYILDPTKTANTTQLPERNLDPHQLAQSRKSTVSVRSKNHPRPEDIIEITHVAVHTPN